MTNNVDFIIPDWPAPANVRAAATTRAGGVSRAPYDSLNLALHVGDDPAAVATNRARLREQLRLPADPFWLRQVHGIRVVDAALAESETEADGSFAAAPGKVCAVLTADCLPVLLCDRQGSRVAALHAGWRGLVSGIIEAGIGALQAHPSELLAWLGPAIGLEQFEVGAEVRAAFMMADVRAETAFHPLASGKYLADLYLLARARLARAGVSAVYGGTDCTVSSRERFYSYRRDGVTGRMASLIWLAGDAAAGKRV